MQPFLIIKLSSMDGLNHRSRAPLLPIRTRYSSFSPFTLFINIARYNLLFLHQYVPIFPHELYFSPISIFIELVMLKWQGMDKSPFNRHPKTMTAAVLSILLFSYCARFYSMNRAVLLFWSFSLVLLASLLLPNSFVPILYVLCFLPPIFELFHSFGMRIWRVFEEWWNVQRIHIIGFFNNPIFTNRMQIPPRLPV